MNTFQAISIVALIIMQLITPILFIYRLVSKKSKSKINSIIELITAWSYFLFVFYAGQWSILPYLIRYILLLFLIIASLKALFVIKNLELWEKKNLWGWLNFSGQLFISVLFIFVNVKIIKGFNTDKDGIELSFPLNEGFISQGGNSTLINYHNADKTAQKFALDIVKLNNWGLRASVFFPKDPYKYQVFGDTVFSPCDCKVVKVKDGLNDLSPGTMDTINLAGNHVILEFNGNLIMLAHLLKNSITVSPNEFVKQGQPIARVGNSGNTTEPHLHIHAIEGTDTSKILNGNGIPIYFDGKFLVRNNLVKKR